jgi:hypothetical protein
MVDSHPTLDHELRDAILKPLVAKLLSASFHQNLLGLGDFRVGHDLTMGRVEIEVENPRYFIVLIYQLVPTIEVVVTITRGTKSGGTSRKLLYYLGSDGRLMTERTPWPGSAVTADRLWDVMIVCGLGAIRERRGTQEAHCDKCAYQFSCLTDKPLSRKR